MVSLTGKVGPAFSQSNQPGEILRSIHADFQRGAEKLMNPVRIATDAVERVVIRNDASNGFEEWIPLQTRSFGSRTVLNTSLFWEALRNESSNRFG